MTRRELGRPADDVESQERDPDVSDGLSHRSSTLPSYEDAVGDTLASEDLSSQSDGKKVSQTQKCFCHFERRSSFLGSMWGKITSHHPPFMPMPDWTGEMKKSSPW